MKTRTDLTRLDRAELESFAVEHGLPKFRGRQLFRWIHGRTCRDFQEMTDLPAALRTTLSKKCEISGLVSTRQQTASDSTVKELFQLPSGRLIETVLIPDLNDDGTASRLTVCVSSQVGCAMGCTFCATGRMGFHENLPAGYILEQVARMDRLGREQFGRPVTNVVFMGMGEPLQNYDEVVRAVGFLSDPETLGLSARRITISTVGLARRIRQLADDGVRSHLAISLHSPSDTKRSSIMPVNRTTRTDLAALRDAVSHYVSVTGRGVTYEYCMFEGFNDSLEDAEKLARVAHWAPSKVNLIMYNPVPGLGFARTDEATLNAFIRVLVRRKVRVTVRRSRGQDIDAACGQLAAAETQDQAGS